MLPPGAFASRHADNSAHLDLSVVVKTPLLWIVTGHGTLLQVEDAGAR